MNSNMPPLPPQYPGSSHSVRPVTISSVMRRVYLKMTIGILVTALVSLWGASTPAVVNLFFGHPWMMFVLMAATFGLVIFLSARLMKISAGTATTLFYVYCILMGLWLFPIFLAYTGVSIAKTFFITAGVFGAMTIFGYTTKQDLSRVGSFLVMALFGLIICMIVNIFLKSSTMEWIISIVGVLIFIGLTAWDTQQIKNMLAYDTGDNVGRIAAIGALTLYMDFINLFLFLLRFFGSSRD